MQKCPRVRGKRGEENFGNDDELHLQEDSIEAAQRRASSNQNMTVNSYRRIRGKIKEKICNEKVVIN